MKNEEKEYVCRECDKYLSSKQSLQNHIESIHKGIIKYQCSQCEKYFTQKGHLTSHVKNIHEDLKDKVTCEICDKTVKGRDYLKFHMKMVHGDGEKKHCPKCDKPYKIYNLNAHIKQCKPREMKPRVKKPREKKPRKTFPCDVCPHESKSASRLVNHKLKHERQKLVKYYKCTHHDCSHETKDKANMNKHQRTHKTIMIFL